MKPPLALYIHLPWCVRKCPYCDFNSHTAGEAPPRRRYLDALFVDLEQEAVRADGRRVEAIFLGGGTPSLFPPGEIAALLERARSLLDVSEDAEITMEANPGTVECGDPAGYRDAGVNRLSIGGQSLDDGSLRRLGRIHSAKDVIDAVGEARSAGIANVNVDLMHGLPGQTVAAALDDLAAAIELGPDHLSWYQLTLEPNTVFFARPPADLPGDEQTWEIQQQGRRLLEEAGFRHYEVSAFARDGRRCRHNLNYWEFGDYLAAGAGAHGKITTGAGVGRYRKAANPAQYMLAMEGKAVAAPPAGLAGPDLVFEFMLNALRLRDGFTDALFAERTGISAGRLAALARTAREKGMLERTAAPGWRATALGWRFLDDLQAEFLPATAD